MPAKENAPQSETFCKYKSKSNIDYQCYEKALSYSKQGFCIFHEPEKTVKDCEKFKKEIDKQIKRGIHKFNGYVFPKLLDLLKNELIDADFSGSTFEEGAIFRGSIFKGNARFSRSTFKGGADFFASIFNEIAFFSGVTFERDADFSGSSFEDGAFFNGSTFEGGVEFYASTFKGGADFNEVTFKGNATFFGATFNERAFFFGSSFERDADFFGTNFEKEIIADRIKFKNISHGIPFFRKAKNASYNNGNYFDQGYYHEREMDAIRSVQGWFSRGWNFIFQKLLHGYGEKPLNVFITSFLLIFLSSLIFSKFGIIATSSGNEIHSFLECLIFSFYTFVTLSYGDFQPIGISRYIAALEGIFGAFLIALFVVTFARRWKR